MELKMVGEGTFKATDAIFGRDCFLSVSVTA